MKTIPSRLLRVIATLAIIPLLALAAVEPDRAIVKKEKAPHNGRLMETEKIGAMHVEFLIEADKTGSVYLYDAKLKAIAPSDQTLSLTIQGKDAAKNKVDLVKKADRFISSAPITIPDGAKAALTIKAEGKTENPRLDLNLSVCAESKNAEYACSCGH